MADLTKKLPFKPTALRNARPKPTPSSSTEDDALQASAAAGYGRSDDGDDKQDTLAMFRRAKEMAPIIEADRERRMRRQQQKQQQEQEAERRRVSAGSKHSLVAEGDDVAGAGAGAEAAKTTTTPTPTATQTSSSMPEDVIMATQEEDNRELVTPPPSKRSRRDTSGSSTRHKDVDLNSNNNTESAPDSPTMRAMRSLAPDRSITPALYNTSLYSSGGIASASTIYKTRSQTREGVAPPLPPGSQVIQLDSDSEPETTTPAAAAAAAAAAAPVEIIDQALTLDLDLNADAPEDDDEFAEYVRKAQEERDKLLLQKEQEAIAAGTITPTPTPASQPPPTGLSSPAPASQTAAAAAAASAATQSIALIITSDIPDSHMCLVKFRFDRPLRVVRDSWTALQHKHGVPLRGLLDRDDDVILTWRRKKVYMTSTLLSLGIRPSDDGSGAALVDGYSRDGFNESRTRVHMQAWTPALFAQMERDEEEAARRRRSHDDDDDNAAAAGSTQGTAAGEGENATAAAEEEGEEEEVQLRIILKSRDKDPVKLRVRPETTTETLVAAFCAQRAVPDGADVGLWFDGMRLASGATMEDADIDDMDTIEVHVR
ncbi:hypothetical protein LMH87_005589 [Akanthomyces muscarius]|uniref:Ubiquitin-like domain-containing protein n=1 Tax=Akanthomyces muscarius TaxID=2231603 RepID=A0A9W8US10_AKAMU|nr:hypothetical protein LMH87_005589 [Akanthomyces muscarius]KAJ4163885.1 hypothetical protein LMH87_005589 [Akanthomyces muscarius]